MSFGDTFVCGVTLTFTARWKLVFDAIRVLANVSDSVLLFV